MKTTTGKPCAKKHVFSLVRVAILSFLILGMVGLGFMPAFGDPTASKNAYVNTSTTAQNGTSANPVVVAQGDTITYEIVANRGNEYPLGLVASPTFPNNPIAAPARVNFINGGFETPVVSGGPGSNFQYEQDYVPGWSTRPTNPADVGNPDAYYIEIQKPADAPGQLYYGQFASHTADGSSQYAELNAKLMGTLYQTCTTVPGTVVYYEFYHGARAAYSGINTDTMNFYLRADGQTSGGLQLVCTDSYTQGSTTYNWGYYHGTYTVPAGQTRTEFAFESTTGFSTGNYLDGVRLFTQSYIVLNVSNNTVAGKARLGDVVTYTIEAENLGESDANNTVLDYTLPIGTDLVPSSVMVDGVPTSFFSYDAATRRLSVNIGARASATAGGLVRGNGSFSNDCNSKYVVTFRTRITGEKIADNYQYQSQAAINYRDRNYEATTSYTNYSTVNQFGVDLSITITDVLPNGLTFQSNEAPAGFTFSNNGQTCTWTHDNWLAASATVKVVTRVNPGNGVLFTNYATYRFAGSSVVETNRTYHFLQSLYTITEKRVDINGNALVPAVSDTTVTVAGNESYSKAIPGVSTYRVVGYFVGNSFSPPTHSYTPGTTASIASVTASATVFFVYEKIDHTITEKHVDINGNALVPAVADTTTGIFDTEPYSKVIPSVSTYRVVGYFVGSTFNPPTHSYTPGTTASIASVTASATVFFVYEKIDHTITEKHVDINGNALVPAVADTTTGVFDTESYSKIIPSVVTYRVVGYFVGNTFTPPTDTYTPGTTASIASVTSNSTVYFVYEKIMHTVTWRFLEADNQSNVLQAQSTTTVADSSTPTRSIGIPPAMIVKEGLIYRFNGYYVDDGVVQNIAWDALPASLIDSVTADTTVTFLYFNKSLLITEVYVTETGAALIPAVPNTYDDVLEGNDYNRVIPSFQSYQTLGYFVGSSFDRARDTYTPDSAIEITSVANDTTIYFIYRRLTTFTFVKVAENNLPLAGVVFDLYACKDSNTLNHVHSRLVTASSDCCWEKRAVATSNSAGQVSFENLPIGDYMLVETKTAPGYLLPASQWLIHIDESSNIVITTQVVSSDTKPPQFVTNALGIRQLPNYPVPPLPITGDKLFILLIVMDILFLAGMGLLITRSKPKRRALA